ncbi:hypothetical protein [Streptomyces cahuitamycinicus]|uniref:Uncharacterized protein n=1 Tax=Streptomyces cahuitamycinicus TaxID=2070367 RepID=A0A2N8TS98_9ACTN|nr:hypothetical protein [Streptomyces cahuitamycinicus]PNG21897.1 hypothetical protein C1J00_12375 [Streptomyces cahuitamycinicus]
MATTDYAELWKALNPRQQFYLKTIFEEDQGREAAQRAAGAAGNYDRRPAAEWRTIDAYHEPAVPDLVGRTELQIRWRGAGHHDQGTGSTIKVLVTHGLITLDDRVTPFGRMHQVAMTKQGRALMRWVTKPPASRTKVPLKERAAEVLGQLYDASSSRLGYLDWARSPTIDKDLIPRGLARSRGTYQGFEITEEGVAHLAEHHAAYAAAYPKLNLPDPSGGVGWPEEADRLLDGLRGECWSLAHASERAEKRAQEERAKADVGFKEEFHRQEGQLALAMYREVSDLKRAHAKVLADTFDGYRAKMRIVLAERLPQYTAATLAAVTAVVEGVDPVAAIRAQTAAAVAELPAYTPTGMVAVDVEGERLYAECQRKRPRRATINRKGKAKAAAGLHTEAVPSPARGTALEQPWALAVHLHRALRDGYLYRLLNAPPEEERPRRRRPAGLLEAPALRLLVALMATENPRRAHHARTEVERYGQATEEELAAIPRGLFSYEVKQATSSTKAPGVLVGRGFAEYMNLARFDASGHYGDNWPLLHVTQAGRDHLAEHREVYAEFHPDVRLPAPLAPAAVD